MTAITTAPQAGTATAQDFANVVWNVDDIQGLRPGMTEDAARALLMSIEGELVDDMIEAGWNRIHAALESTG